MDLSKVWSQNSVTWTLYKENGEALLRLQLEDGYGSVLNVDDCDDVALYETEIDGKPYLYVVQ